MHPDLEATMARGRAAGITQRVATAIGRDGRTVQLEPGGPDVRSFATCSYLALDRDPRLAAAAIAAVEQHGVAFSASRCFVTSPLYAEADALLAELFDRPVVLAGSTTLAHGAALPILLERKDVVLFDQQVHHSVQTALAALGPRGPRCEAVGHAHLGRLEQAIVAALAGGARRVWYCADGIYSMFGDRLDTAGLATLMGRYPALHAYLDDAHGMSWCGPRGAGSLADVGLPRDRTVIATSLSKGFGCAGGVIAVPDVATKQRIENLGPSLMFSIQLPPPVLGAVCASARVHLGDELPGLQATLAARTARARARVAADPELAVRAPRIDGAPVPIQYLILGDTDTTLECSAWLLAHGFLVNPVSFPAVPRHAGGIRITITRAHTDDDLDALFAAVGDIVRARARPRLERKSA